MSSHPIQFNVKSWPERGFSLIELLIVMAIMMIMTMIAVSALYAGRQLTVTDDQALKILEMMREARQIAITKRRPVRFELDPTARRIRVIDTAGVGTGDDLLIREEPMINAPVSVVVDSGPPSGVAVMPYTDYPQTTFTSLPHPVYGGGGNVWAAVFLNNGSIIDPSSAGSGSTPVPVSNTILIQNLQQGAATVRAVTVFGGTNSVRMWRFMNGMTGPCSNGKDQSNGWCGM